MKFLRKIFRGFAEPPPSDPAPAATEPQRTVEYASYEERWRRYHHVPHGLTEKEIRRRIYNLTRDYGQNDYGIWRARAHRAAGELYEYLGEWKFAIGEYRIALQYDSKVGVKKRLRELEEHYDIDGRLEKLRKQRAEINTKITRISRKISEEKDPRAQKRLYDEAGDLQTRLVQNEMEEDDLLINGIKEIFTFQ